MQKSPRSVAFLQTTTPRHEWPAFTPPYWPEIRPALTFLQCSVWGASQPSRGAKLHREFKAAGYKLRCEPSRCMVCDRELTGFQRSFAADYLPENGTAFKRVARSALFEWASARAGQSVNFPVLFQKRKHIGCTSGLTAIERCDVEASAAVGYYLENAFRRAVAGSYS